MDEFFEIFTWFQLGFHQKPCAILNINGYYDHLLAFLQHAVESQFLQTAHVQSIMIENEVSPLIARLKNTTRLEVPSKLAMFGSA